MTLSYASSRACEAMPAATSPASGGSSPSGRASADNAACARLSQSWDTRSAPASAAPPSVSAS